MCWMSAAAYIHLAWLGKCDRAKSADLWPQVQCAHLGWQQTMFVFGKQCVQCGACLQSPDGVIISKVNVKVCQHKVLKHIIRF